MTKKPSQIELTKRFKQLQKLIKNAYCPYSKFATASIIETDCGEFCGINVENSSYPVTNCAERSAVFAAITAGAKKIKVVYLLSSSGRSDITPCGACRQVLSEFMLPQSPVYVFNKQGKLTTYCLNDLLPNSFTPTQLLKKQ